MGITWIYEDSQEAVYSNTEKVPPPGGRAPLNFVCPFCDAVYTNFPAMQRHATSQHRLQRPALLWNGYEVGGDRKIVSHGSFAVTSCTTASIAIDGTAAKSILTSELPTVLDSAVNSVIRVWLENRPDKKMAPAVSAYRLEFRIPDQDSLSSVEAAFRHHVVRSTPTPDTIRIFLEDPRCAGVASEYAAGLYAYVHALMLKERLNNSALFSAYAMHSERFGEALQKLEQVDRKLASMICTIVRLMRNDISGRVDSAQGNIGIAYAMLRGPMGMASMKGFGSSAQNERLFPVDHGTSRVIALASRLAAAERWSELLEDECRSFSSSDIFPIDDRRKIFAYWAVTALRLGCRKAARYPLQQIANIYPFDQWAADALAEYGQDVE
ncbi:hypothetical protein [Mesorhizobium sp. WSM3873]|uniref:hypothetical protein n=1 Tax=Mesorhizobium sp. WSM3873 TaxID=1854056 RepID=UPI0008010E04|nr:hypothetical protein [Mesorhizobium sp. WSM3873]OBQ82988.1 hypothetical protein A9K71_25770 [Mesorhizobium sp. WSM3873]